MTDAHDGDPADLIDVEEASSLLQVPVEQVHAMVDEGMLSSADSASSTPRFRRAEVIAVRELGG